MYNDSTQDFKWSIEQKNMDSFISDSMSENLNQIARGYDYFENVLKIVSEVPGVGNVIDSYNKSIHQTTVNFSLDSTEEKYLMVEYNGNDIYVVISQLSPGYIDDGCVIRNTESPTFEDMPHELRGHLNPMLRYKRHPVIDKIVMQLKSWVETYSINEVEFNFDNK